MKKDWQRARFEIYIEHCVYMVFFVTVCVIAHKQNIKPLIYNSDVWIV